MSGHAYKRMSLADIELLLRMHEDGKTQEQIAEVIGCTQSAVSQQLAKLKETPAFVQALMKGDSLNALKQWKRATRIAAKRGDHRPAREWIEAAHPELRPQSNNHGGGGGVTVYVAVPGATNPRPVIDVSPTSATLSPPLSHDLHKLSD
jgi:hypothetical protein